MMIPGLSSRFSGWFACSCFSLLQPFSSHLNYEDKDLTTAIDLATHKTVAKWQSSCAEDGPHGLSVDQEASYLLVACSTRAEVLDAGHKGEKLSSINTSDGVDDLNYAPATHTLYVGAAKD